MENKGPRSLRAHHDLRILSIIHTIHTSAMTHSTNPYKHRQAYKRQGKVGVSIKQQIPRRLDRLGGYKISIRQRRASLTVKYHRCNNNIKYRSTSLDIIDIYNKEKEGEQTCTRYLNRYKQPPIPRTGILIVGSIASANQWTSREYSLLRSNHYPDHTTSKNRNIITAKE